MAAATLAELNVVQPPTPEGAKSRPGGAQPGFTTLDTAEFERLAVEHAQSAWRYAFAFANDRAAADDLLQEALLRLFERRDEYPLRTHFGPYLIKTVARLAMDEQRQRRVQERHAPARESTRPRTQSPDPAVHAQKVETYAVLAGAVAEVPERDRACLLLAVCEGMSYVEIGAILNRSASDVNNAIYRARLLLRARLSGLSSSASSRDAFQNEGNE